jgi:magnesium-protoporphyrin IX monomethyl ester (oxidative) cyclase
MRILLVAPAKLQNMKATKGTIPIPLLYLASSLRAKSHTPFICDLSIIEGSTSDAIEDLPETLKQSILDFKPELFAINCFTSLHFHYISSIAKLLHSNYKGIPIVIGGAHPSLFPIEILTNCPYVDYISVGESEEQITQLADALSNNGFNANLSHIQSFAWRMNGEIIYQSRKSFINDLDLLPDPAWDLINIKNYHSDHSQWNNPKKLSFNLAVPILSSRSCPFTCNFCAAYTTMGRKFRKRSPKRVVDEIQMLHECYGENYFSFLDDNINLDKKHILTICSEICKRGLNIEFETLSGLHIGSLDNEVIQAIDQAGCVFVRLPIEHGNDRIRNEVIGKKLDRKKIYEVCAAFKKVPKIRTASMFIMGFPEDTCETLEDTRKMILDLELDFNQVSNLLPFPCTSVFEQSSRDGLLLNKYNPDRLWAGETCLDPTESEFFILPYSMTLVELKLYRTIFDNLRFLPNSRILKSSELIK